MQRLDVFLAKMNKDVSRGLIQKFIRARGVAVNGKLIKKTHWPVLEDDEIKFSKKAFKDFLNSQFPNAKSPAIGSESVIFKNKDFFVVDKSPFVKSEDLINGHLPVHRLDKDTSGVLVIANSPVAQAKLQKQWQDRKVLKTYIALIKGVLTPSKGAVEAGIARSLKDRRKMAVSSSSKSRGAVTEYEVISHIEEPQSGEKLTLVKAFPKTGRTHQIRVHFASIHHPVVGDSVYGDKKINNIFAKKYGLKRQFLHAAELELVNPSTGKRATFTSKIPDDLAGVLKKLEK